MQDVTVIQIVSRPELHAHMHAGPLCRHCMILIEVLGFSRCIAICNLSVPQARLRLAHVADD